MKLQEFLKLTHVTKGVGVQAPTTTFDPIILILLSIELGF